MRRVVVALLAVVLLVPVGCRMPVAKPQKPRISRDEFTKAVVGKTAQQVIERFGTPDSNAKSDSLQIYDYRDATFDPVTKTDDRWATVTIRNNVVDSTSFISK